MATTRKTSTRKTSMKSSTKARSATKSTAKTARKPANVSAAREAAVARASAAAQAAKTAATATKEAPAVLADAPVKTSATALVAGVTQTEAVPVVPGEQPDVTLTKRALLERVAARSGLRKAQARPIVDAMLAELGEALSRGETLKLQPLGVMKVTRTKALNNADVMVCKLRRKKSEKGGGDPLAEAAE